jgi:hypothetical protein
MIGSLGVRMHNSIESTIFCDCGDLETETTCLPIEDLRFLSKLSPTELRRIGRCLSEADAPLTDESCRQSIYQFLRDGGSLALLRM